MLFLFSRMCVGLIMTFSYFKLSKYMPLEGSFFFLFTVLTYRYFINLGIRWIKYYAKLNIRVYAMC